MQVEFERDILLAIIEAAAPELGRLDQLRMDGKLDGEATDEKLKRAAGVASNDLVRLSNALKDLELP